MPHNRLIVPNAQSQRSRANGFSFACYVVNPYRLAEFPANEPTTRRLPPCKGSRPGDLFDLKMTDRLDPGRSTSPLVPEFASMKHWSAPPGLQNHTTEKFTAQIMGRITPLFMETAWPQH